MPRRKIVLATDQIYHVFNRSVAKEILFLPKINLNKALEIANFYRFPQRLRLSKFKSLTPEVKSAYLASLNNIMPLVEIYAFAFMPNHYHFLLKQLQDGGISRFIGNFQNSFAKIYNLKNNRNGAVFQNQFRAKRPETDDEFLHISRYIHLNPVTAYLIEFKDLVDYLWTSFPAYAQNKPSSFLNTTVLNGMVGPGEEHVRFVGDQIDYQRTLDSLKHLVME